MSTETWHQKGDRLKQLENQMEQQVPKDSSFVIRLDGCAFHTFTRGMIRPFDLRLVSCMEQTTKDLVLKFNAVTGYTQSDEISLLFTAPDVDAGQTHLYSGRIQKLCSIVASYATLQFNRHLATHDWNKEGDQPTLKKKVLETGAYFDARVLVVDMEQAVDCFAWRHVFDGQRNAVMAVAQTRFSSKELHKVNQRKAVEMLSEIGVDLEDRDKFPAICLYGCFVKRVKVEKTAKDFRTGEDVQCIRTEAASFSQKEPLNADQLFAKYGNASEERI